ncbi:MAG: 2-C-methyl-D-erythritol 2,4-cyclodiphosphate synthase [SAR86 cluster bacterium]|nr:2-C-methyl-D-erythritol 2,4-cyclodiphosphate synthase [SAR86 cluster bacterium]
MRVGFGYDAHKLIPGKGMVLGGIFIESEFSIEAYSDGDVIIHALIDSLLGAAALGDIGGLFPSEDPKNEEVSSRLLLNEVVSLLSSKHYEIINVDITLIAEEPKIREQIDLIIECISKDLKIEKEYVSCKATTTDGLGFEGTKKGIACQAVSLIKKSL